MHVMREADRPPAERVSVLDRALNSADRLAVESVPSLMGLDGRVERVRLALEVRDRRVLIGRDSDDGLYLIVSDSRGGGASGGTRRVLREHGAIKMVSSDTQRVLVSGVVPDEVTAVRVGDALAYLRNNGFLAEIGRDDSPVVVITTPAGEREVGPQAP
jgi:hypothetical protein